MNPANSRSSTVNLSTKHNIHFAHPEPVYVYTDIIKPNLAENLYVRSLTTLHFSTNTGYLRFDCALYYPVEQSFKESNSICVVIKNGQELLFDESDILNLVVL